MSNSYFQFKQFVIHQDRCAMKVCTDACLFGAIVAQELKQQQVLDIGAGTGLLSLMYAQKNPSSRIHSVEIDPSAAEQAKKNYRGSQWNERIEIYCCDINTFSKEIEYDLLISNPPFFEDDLLSSIGNRNAAKHHSSLELKQLLHATIRNLSINGTLAILLPERRISYFESEALSVGLYLNYKILVRHSPGHDIFRGILFFTRKKSEPLIKEMSIQRTDGNYTTEFIALLKDYYLYL